MYTYQFNPVFFLLISMKSFKIFFKHNRYDFVSEFFALNWYIFVALAHKIIPETSVIIKT